jgi:hypothetical protein
MRHVVLLLCLLWGANLGATRMVPLSIEQISAAADLVVNGVVRKVTVTRDPDHGIVTRVLVEVRELWKGESPPTGTCEVVSRGGILGELSVSSGAEPVYHLGEELVLYLVRSPSGHLVPVGMAQGCFHVTSDSATGERHVHNVFWGEPGDDRAPAGSGMVRSPMNRPITLKELRRRTTETQR